ncbi:hypothetical protein MUN81_19160 [Hymenobacter sp. 5317J-9]|uniref:hypothetical protein n=1 Tax=Hymenobacter sp. 5317J-9 TaxID=2932250 RepID=UPI001FD6F948|nr:hypothetical protein [Hymenobacter sp. 5317J-9]UOQ97343.1 hypothetical protein MUN81_19160 [Hymenobacter sp. 5317J-9]
MRNPFVLWLVLGLIVLAEWYGYQAVRTLVQHSSPGVRRWVSIGYWVLTGVVWWLAIWAGSTRQTGNTVLKSYLMSLPLLLLAAKMVMLIPLLLEDLTRLGRWVLSSATRPAGGRARPFRAASFWPSWPWGWALFRFSGCYGAWPRAAPTTPCAACS